MAMIAIFFVVSALIGIIALKKPSILLVAIISSFFPYYCAIGLLNVRLVEGGSKYIHLSFLLVVLVCWLIAKRRKFTINDLDILYIGYYFLWLIVYLANFDESLLTFKQYRYAPYFLTITFILPIIIKPIYNQETVKDFLKYLEWTGYLAATIITICLLVGVTSKETGVGYEITDLSEAYRYAPFRGFFSIRQAGLLSASIIIFFSKFMSGKSSKKEIIVKLPFLTLCFLGIIISGTRGIFIILSLLCCYLVITRGNFTRKTNAVIAVAVIGIILLHVRHIHTYSHLFSRTLASSSYTLKVGGVKTRYEHYEQGLRNFIKRPLVGNGMTKMCRDYDYSHSIVISILEDTGLSGFFIMCLMATYLFHRCEWHYRKEMFKDNQFIIRTMIMFHFLTSNLYGTVATNYTLFLLLYMYYLTYKRSGQAFRSYTDSSGRIELSLGKV